MKEKPKIRFLADAMVGKLGRWLRILGYDVSTFKRQAKQTCESRNKLLEKGRVENRLILTRDPYLLKQRNLPACLFIQDDYLEDQLRQVLKDLHLKPEPFLNRCLDCNSPLVDIPKEEAKNRVPPYVFQTQTEFSECPHCKKIYWEGTHVERMIDRLKQIKSFKH